MERPLRFHDLKPHLAGSLWRLGGAIGPWSEPLLDYVRLFDFTLRRKMPLLVAKVTGDRDHGRLEWRCLDSVICRQRVVGAAGAAAEALIVPLDNVLAEELVREDPEAIGFCGLAFRSFYGPSWLKDLRDFPEYESERWDLFQVAFCWPFILLSAPARTNHTAIVSAINDWMSEATPLFIEPVSAAMLDAAFIGEETSRTSLLGLHRRSPGKADRKTLSGLDLRYALDPVGDQTYAFTSGRAKLRLEPLMTDLKGIEVGKLIAEAFPAPTRRRSTAQTGSQGAGQGVSAPGESPSAAYSRAARSISIGATPGIVDFARRLDLVRLLLQVTEARLAASAPGAAIFNDPIGLGYLANPVSLAELDKVSQPFEAQFSALRIDDVASAGSALADLFEAWERHGNLRPGEVEPDAFGAFTVPITIEWHGVDLATLSLMVSRNDDRLECQAKVLDIQVDNPSALRLVDRLIEHGGDYPVDLRFESGHVLADGNLYRPTLREVLFENWFWLPSDAGGRSYQASLEKPPNWSFGQTPNPDQIIEASDSLFSRVARHADEVFNVSLASDSWVLLCHDQPEEIADFIFVDADTRRLELIHVKSATGATKREIAIGPYEKVVPQAVKNLRHLDPQALLKRFDDAHAGGKNLGIFCVYAEAGRIRIDPMPGRFHDRLKALAERGPAKRAKVVCYAPQVRETLWQAQVDARARSPSEPLRAAYMLSMLLLNARSACTGFNADFEVWSEADAPANAA